MRDLTCCDAFFFSQVGFIFSHRRFYCFLAAESSRRLDKEVNFIRMIEDRRQKNCCSFYSRVSLLDRPLAAVEVSNALLLGLQVQAALFHLQLR